jgi:hypothetical protein
MPDQTKPAVPTGSTPVPAGVPMTAGELLQLQKTLTSIAMGFPVGSKKHKQFSKLASRVAAELRVVADRNFEKQVTELRELRSSFEEAKKAADDALDHLQNVAKVVETVSDVLTKATKLASLAGLA